MPRFLRVHTLAAGIAVMALSGCTANQPGDTASASPSPASGRPVPSEPLIEPVPSDSPGPIGEVPAELFDAILADAARRTETDPVDIETLRAEAVTWPDGSLGCPEQGQTYTQALVDGYHVVLEADRETLDYRVTAGGTFRLCAQSGRPGES